MKLILLNFSGFEFSCISISGLCYTVGRHRRLHDALFLMGCSRGRGGHMSTMMNPNLQPFNPDTDLEALVGSDALSGVFEERASAEYELVESRQSSLHISPSLSVCTPLYLAVQPIGNVARRRPCNRAVTVTLSPHLRSARWKVEGSKQVRHLLMCLLD